MTHKELDAASLAMARRVAEGLAAHPEWMELAKENLARWAERHADSPGLLANYCEWGAILERGMEEVRRVLLDESDEGQRLRQNSPFPGALSPKEVWQIKREYHATV